MSYKFGGMNTYAFHSFDSFEKMLLSRYRATFQCTEMVVPESRFQTLKETKGLS